MTWILVLYLPFLLAFLLVARGHGGLVAPDALLVVFNAVALLGTLLVVDADSPVDTTYAWLVIGLTTLLTFCVTLGRAGWGPMPPLRRRGSVAPTPLTPGLLLLYAVSVLVCVVYYVAVGHITLVSSLRSGAGFDAASARLASYAGSDYFFPGYVNQFKNAVLPALTVAVVHSLWTRGVRFRLPVSAVLVAVTFVFVAGTGQRAPMVITILVIVLAAGSAGILRGRQVALVGLVGFGAFTLLTTVLQRQADALDQADGPFGAVGVFVGALWSRVVLENPASGLYAFHYTEGLPFANGSEWLTDVMGVLPGTRGSDLANQVFAMLYGTTRGTAPASLWGGMYYNFGALGSVVVTVVIALVYVLMSRRALVGLRATAEPNFLRHVALAGMSVSAGAWIAGSPLTVLNQGFFAYVALFVIARRVDERRPEPEAAGAPTTGPTTGPTRAPAKAPARAPARRAR